MVDLYGLDTNAGSFTILKEPGGKLLLSKGVFYCFRALLAFCTCKPPGNMYCCFEVLIFANFESLEDCVYC